MKETIKKIARDSSRHPIDVYYDLYTKILEPTTEEKKSVLLKEIVEASQVTYYDESKPIEAISGKFVEESINKYQGILKEMIQTIMLEDLSVSDFYDRLWECLNNPFFKHDSETMTVLLYLLGEGIRGIPYYKAENILTLSNEKYGKAIDIIKDKLTEGKSMALRPFEQRTETVSQLYRIADSITDLVDDEGNNWSKDLLRIVFWSAMSRIFEVMGKMIAEKERN